MTDIQHANNAPRCEHIKYDDVRCGAPALRGRRHCRFHASARSTHEPFPTIEDGLSLQVGLNQIVRSIIDGSLERKTASLVLYAFQIMCSNLKRMNEERKLATKSKEEELPGPSLAETLLDRLDHLLEEDPPTEPPIDPDPWNLNPHLAGSNQQSEIGNQKWLDRSTGVPPVTPASEPHPQTPSNQKSEIENQQWSEPPTNNQPPTTNNSSPNAQSPEPAAPALVNKIHACATANCLTEILLSRRGVRRVGDRRRATGDYLHLEREVGHGAHCDFFADVHRHG